METKLKVGEGMRHYTGHYFCTKSNWGGEHYGCSNLVTIDGWANDTAGNYYGIEDWNNLVDVIDHIRESRRVSTFRLKKEVTDWLHSSVKNTSKGERGWCVGSDEYNSHGMREFCIFFYRRKDALNFIKTWSVYKKPTETYNQNTCINKKLDILTMTLKIKELK
jgi:hypothetical protein